MNQEFYFPCEQCGAKLRFSAATGELQCPYCAHINKIERSATEAIVEHDYEKALQRIQERKKEPLEVQNVTCNACGALFELRSDTHAASCPYCDTPVVLEPSEFKPIKPQAILPFTLTPKEAKAAFKEWLSGLWFAPSKLKKYAADNDTLQAIYVPYWTYDAATHSYYKGQRGDAYYVNESYMTSVNGRQTMRTRRVRKIRWHPVSGELDKSFDDILVLASRSIKYRLERWDLNNLVDYDSSYLSGYQSELYTVELDEGLARAKTVMQSRIRDAVRRKIGGDEQRIEHLETSYSDITFKHILLPVYASAFHFDGKTYAYVVNGRNGEIKGERPYSKLKIALAILGAIAAGAALYYFIPQS